MRKKKLMKARKMLNRACIHLLNEFADACDGPGDAFVLPEEYGDSFDAALETLRDCRIQVELELTEYRNTARKSHGILRPNRHAVTEPGAAVVSS